MRRLVPILLVLSLALGAFALAGCSGVRRPGYTHEYVVSEHCYPIDRNGNPIYREP